MQLLFDAPELRKAQAIGEQFDKEFPDYLAFATNLKVRLKTLFRYLNWEQGSSMREGLILDARSRT